MHLDWRSSSRRKNKRGRKGPPSSCSTFRAIDDVDGRKKTNLTILSLSPLLHTHLFALHSSSPPPPDEDDLSLAARRARERHRQPKDEPPKAAAKKKEQAKKDEEAALPPPAAGRAGGQGGGDDGPRCPRSPSAAARPPAAPAAAAAAMPPPPRLPPPPPPPMRMQQHRQLEAAGGGERGAPPGEELPPGVGGAAAPSLSLPLSAAAASASSSAARRPRCRRCRSQPARTRSTSGGPHRGQTGFRSPDPDSQQQQQQRRAEEGQLLAQLQLQPRVAALFRPPPPLEHLPPFALSRRKRNARAAGRGPARAHVRDRSVREEFAKEEEEAEEKEKEKKEIDGNDGDGHGDGDGELEEEEESAACSATRCSPSRPASPRASPRPGMLLPPLERRSARLEAARARNEEEKRRGVEAYNPKEDPNAAGSDPYRTLFVARLPFDVDEATLRGEFEEFGPVSRVSIVVSKGCGRRREPRGGGDGGGDGDERKKRRKRQLPRSRHEPTRRTGRSPRPPPEGTLSSSSSEWKT